MARPSDCNRAATRWTTRLIPVFILALFGVGTYALVCRLCVQYLLRARGSSGLAAAFLALYFVFLLLALATYLRTLASIQRDPGLVPLLHPGDCKQRRRDAEADAWTPPDQSPDNPGLEAFYSKDVFVCESDGRPRWCSDCCQWKPDRAHHSSELGRCVRKMDHLCPWVGGMVAEMSFNFFFQFTFYATCLCAVSVAAGAYCLQQQNQHGSIVDGWVIAVIALASLFGFFTFVMTLTSARFIFTNMTNIDLLRKAQVFFLAVRIPRNIPPVDRQASRTFAILRTKPRENPWNLGFWENWKSVMGNNMAEWLFPIRHSPCCNHESMESDYQLGPLLAKLKERYGVPETYSDVGGKLELHHAGPSAI